jgi:hypothetical protein
MSDTLYIGQGITIGQGIFIGNLDTEPDIFVTEDSQFYFITETDDDTFITEF